MDKVIAQKIAEYIQEQTSELADSEEAVESLEVAKQCLETAYELDLAQISSGPTLKEIFTAGCKSLKFEPETADTAANSSAASRNPLLLAAKNAAPSSEEDKVKGAELKSKGNEFMTSCRYLEAVDAYSQALELEPANPVYYGNRAAAYSKLGENDLAIRDCEVALAVDPTYSKAYGRMGLAHAAAARHQDAVGCYRKALELDPRNQGYQQNLAIAEKKLSEEQQASSVGVGGLPAGMPPGLAGMFGGGVGGGGAAGLGGMDVNALLNNPALMNMASQMMQNPQMQQMMGNMMRNMGGAPGGGAPGGGAPGGGATAGGGAAGEAPGAGGAAGANASASQAENLSFLMNAGRNMASQMMENQPDVIEQLRNQNQAESSAAPPNPPPGDSTDSKQD